MKCGKRNFHVDDEEYGTGAGADVGAHNETFNLKDGSEERGRKGMKLLRASTTATKHNGMRMRFWLWFLLHFLYVLLLFLWPIYGEGGNARVDGANRPSRKDERARRSDIHIKHKDG